MLLASLPRFSRAAPDGERLTLLRERALGRLDEEEKAAGVVGPVSRRGVLRGLGMMVAGVVPAVAMLEKAYAGSVRSGAPQYGAPNPWPIPYDVPPPSMAEPGSATVTNSREELGKPDTWIKGWALILPQKRDERAAASGLVTVDDKRAYYRGEFGGAHALVAVADPGSGGGYIVRGDQSFYAATETDMLAAFLEPGVLALHGSIFRSDAGGMDGAIEGFAHVSDWAAYGKDGKGTKIKLEGLPMEFWVRDSEDGWRTNDISMAYVARQGDVVELHVRSGGKQSIATFAVDLKTKKLVKTTFEGKEWTP